MSDPRQVPGASRAGRPLKVLILKPSSLGDVVQALPVLRALKKGHPASEIYWWLEKGLLPLLEGDPDLAGLMPFDRAGFSTLKGWRVWWQQLLSLRGHRFDWVIDLQSLARSGLVAWLANADFTIGLEDWREGAPAFYDQAVTRPSADAHAVDWYLRVLSFLNTPICRDFEWLPMKPAVAAAVRSQWLTGGVAWILLQPGGRWENKRWPVDYYAEVARGLAERFRTVRLAVLGSRGERGLGDVICQACPERCVNLAGQISLPEMVEWIRMAALMVTNDTGPMHVAAALRRPLIALFGPTEPRRTGPYGGLEKALQAQLPCVPCLKDYCRWAKPMECLRAITPAMVIARASELLEKTEMRPGDHEAGFVACHPPKAF